MKRFQLKKRLCVWSFVWTLSASLAWLLCCLPAFSQGGLGTINGTVTSMAGGPVAGATVSIIDTARGVTYPLTTDSAGLYSQSGLTPSAYTVRVEAMGFKTMEHTGITLPTGATLVVDFILQPGAASEVVTITAEVLPANAAAVVKIAPSTRRPSMGEPSPP